MMRTALQRIWNRLAARYAPEDDGCCGSGVESVDVEPAGAEPDGCCNEFESN